MVKEDSKVDSEAYLDDLRQRIAKRMRDQKDSKSVSIIQKNLRRRQAQIIRENKINAEGNKVLAKLEQEKRMESLETEPGDGLDNAIARQ